MTDTIIWYGELTTSRSLLRRGLAHLSPGIAWTLVFLAIPMLALIPVGFASRGSYGQIVWEFTWNNFYRLLGYGTYHALRYFEQRKSIASRRSRSACGTPPAGCARHCAERVTSAPSWCIYSSEVR